MESHRMNREGAAAGALSDHLLPPAGHSLVGSLSVQEGNHPMSYRQMAPRSQHGNGTKFTPLLWFSRVSPRQVLTPLPGLPLSFV